MSTLASVATASGPAIFMVTVPITPVLQNTPACRIIPVPIQPALPHITLQLGSVLGSSKCPAICCVIDTAAALSTGNLHFFAAITKAYPHTVAAIHSQSDYLSITLSGIIQQGGALVTTDLTVGFQFHMPYLTRDSHPTTLTIATGPDVTVNTILSLPFIQQTKMIIDTSDQVANLWALDHPPFDINFHRAMCTVPDINKMPGVPSKTSTNYTNIIWEITAIVAYHSAHNIPTGPILKKRILRVAFDGSVTAPPIANDSSTATIGSSIEETRITYDINDFDNADPPCSA